MDEHGKLVRDVAAQLDLDRDAAEVVASGRLDTRAHDKLVADIAEHLDLAFDLAEVRFRKTKPADPRTTPELPAVPNETNRRWLERKYGWARGYTFGERLGLRPGMVVKEFGWDPAADDEIRASIESWTDSELLDEDDDRTADVALLWWRAGDGDLPGALARATRSLSSEGAIWVLTPSERRPGHVDPRTIADAAAEAGLADPMRSVPGVRWSATLIVTPETAASAVDTL